MDSVSWKDIQSCPVYVINLERRKDRLDTCMHRIKDAGFTNVQRFHAIDALNDDLNKAWGQHGSPKLNKNDQGFVEHIGRQGVALSHYGIWKNMIDNNVPYVVVFEDDVEFHKDWHNLGEIYWNHSPRDFDILFMGCQMNIPMDGNIVVTPVFCLHAYVITLNGAKIMYDLCVNDPNGTYTIDCMIIDHMKATFATNGKHYPFKWYAWNGRMFPDPNTDKPDSKWALRNDGLVFQDSDLGTDIIQW